ncbi:MAG TPA: formate/nitrite transporter family protein [Gaiellaceae bacterium]|nr:formate/nitrite transporter family protein [Gaiellaceae bacterium]
MTEIPQPQDIYRRTREVGARRIERPLLEMISTALAAGFDIVAGIVALGIAGASIESRTGLGPAHVVGSLAFGIGFVFLVVGRGELFTENFLVPIAGLDHRRGSSWLGLAKLWVTSPLFNILGGLVIILLLTTHGVLPNGTAQAFARNADELHTHGTLALFVSAIFAGALITAMTWFVEGQESMLVRVVVAWIAGALLAIGSFNHVIVATLELIFGHRFGAHFAWTFILGNFFLAAAGNMLGGIGLVTLNRLTQGKQGERKRASA